MKNCDLVGSLITIEASSLAFPRWVFEWCGDDVENLRWTYESQKKTKDFQELYYIKDTLWLFNIAMENGPFTDDGPAINLHLEWIFQFAMLNNQMVNPFGRWTSLNIHKDQSFCCANSGDPHGFWPIPHATSGLCPEMRFGCSVT